MTTRRNYFKFSLYLLAATGFSSSFAGSYDDFFSAISRDDDQSVLALLQRGFDPNTRNPQGQVGLFLALQTRSLKVAQALMRHPGLQVDAANEAGETPLMIAALKGETDWCRQLLSKGAAVDKPGWTPLHYAAASPEPAAVQLLLDSGAAVNARSPNGTTPLMMAARYGREESVGFLLARGADPTLTNSRGLDAAAFARLGGRDALAAELDKRARRRP